MADGAARSIKRARYALWKNPENLTEHQAAKLAWIAKTDPRLYRAYLLKEGLRHAFAVKGKAGKDAIDAWTSWARRCRIRVFVELQRKIVKHRAAIDATLDHGLSNGLIESTNTKIRLLTRIAFGFRSPDALIALAIRWAASRTSRPELTHGSVRRARFLDARRLFCPAEVVLGREP
jgi:transposase